MRRFVESLVVGCAFAPLAAFAAESDTQTVGRDIGAVLAWRLGPEVVEEKCRDAEPAGAEVRKKSLETWQTKNAALIKAVDERVAEIVPLAYPSEKPEKTIEAVRDHVKKLLLETVSANGDVELLKTACKAEADPKNPRWTSNGLPQTQNSLAALYDWKIQHEKTLEGKAP